jgi:hypothetical protein
MRNMLIVFYRGLVAAGYPATALMMLELARNRRTWLKSPAPYEGRTLELPSPKYPVSRIRNLPSKELTSQFCGLVRERLGKDVVALRKGLSRLFPEALRLLVLLSPCNGQLLVIDVPQSARGREQQRADLFVGFGVCRSRSGTQLALRFGHGLSRLRHRLGFPFRRRRGCASRGSALRNRRGFRRWRLGHGGTCRERLLLLNGREHPRRRHRHRQRWPIGDRCRARLCTAGG